MVKKIMFIFLLLFCVPVLAMLQPTPIYTQDQLSITVKRNQPEFVIKLKSNPTTGYSWSLREYNANLIELVKHNFEAPSNEQMVGAPGFEYWTFRVKPAGFTPLQQTLIQFAYVRPWEQGPAATVLVFKVTTKNTRFTLN